MLVRQGRIRHSSPDHRSQLGALLPGLIRDAQIAARIAEDRRSARRTLAGPTYRHVHTSFSQPVMAAHATTLGVELRQPGEALRAVRSIDADHIVSVPRRSRHLIEVARAHTQRDENTAARTMLVKSEQTAPETIRYNGFARDMLRGLLKKQPTGMRTGVRELSQRVGVRV
ncbi:hypothetical protein [Nocardia sp. NBC_01327]|uniref:hypothetical protein n=1 Tax=Nocardia sp. NBC_01327 TaxID=2903593 RepID=UPI002E10189D|nr:hypothetical protein OG326_37630 [Nocardia sp. NBC_01327]